MQQILTQFSAVLKATLAAHDVVLTALDIAWHARLCAYATGFVVMDCCRMAGRYHALLPGNNAKVSCRYLLLKDFDALFVRNKGMEYSDKASQSYTGRQVFTTGCHVVGTMLLAFIATDSAVCNNGLFVISHMREMTSGGMKQVLHGAA